MRVDDNPFLVIVVLVASMCGCTPRGQSPTLDPVLRESRLGDDLRSNQRESIRLGSHYLWIHAPGAPRYDIGDETLAEWQSIGRMMFDWLEASPASDRSALIESYPDFLLLQSPYYGDWR